MLDEEISQCGRLKEGYRYSKLYTQQATARQRRIQIQQATARRIQKQQATNTPSYRYRYSKLQIEKDIDTASGRYSQKDTDRGYR